MSSMAFLPCKFRGTELHYYRGMQHSAHVWGKADEADCVNTPRLMLRALCGLLRLAHQVFKGAGV